MAKIVAELTMSLDGFSAGPNVSEAEPMGVGGEILHHWMFDGKGPVEEQLLAATRANTGAVLVGRHTYDVGIETGWGGENPFPATAFVVSHRPVSKKVPGFVYISEGAEAAAEQARAAAGEKEVWLMGGARLIQYFLAAGLADELYIHIAPVLLRGGFRLFENHGLGQIELEQISSVHTAAAQHLRYRVKK